MTHASEEVINALKSARESKGLSQRALSARTGVPQSHISKIENGSADIRLSSLIEIARALDLELKLVPRKAVPAVDSVVRSTAPRPRTEASYRDAVRDLRRSLDAVNQLRSTFPELSALRTLQDNLKVASHFKEFTRFQDEIRNITNPLREIQKQAEQLKRLQEAVALPSQTLKQIQEAASAAQQLRNHLVHSRPAAQTTPRPAYRLDEDEENDNG